MSEYFVGSTGANNQTNFSSLDTSEVLDDLGLNTGDSPTFSGLFLEGSGSTIFSVDGSNGRLFGVTDEVTGTVFSVNDAAGLPIIEVESTSSYDKITLGEYGSDLLVLSGQNTIEITGSQIASQSWVGQQGFITSGGTDDQNLNEVLAEGNTSSYGISVNQITGTALTIDTDTLFVDSTNDRVGIGTTSPKSILELASQNPVINFKDTNAGADLSYRYIQNVDGKFLFAKANDAYNSFTTHMAIDTDGNVGIGITSPNELLHVEDSSSSSGTSIAIQNAFGESPKNIKFRYNDTVETARIEGFGRNNTSQLPYLAFHVNQTTSSSASNDVAERMRIDSSGNVGIGTTSPASLLHISSSTSGDAVVIIESDTDNNNEDDNPQLQFKQDGGNTIAKAGLAGNAGTIFTDSLANAAYFGNDEAASLQLYTNATARLTIESGGDVGIGTTNPSAKLDVVGASELNGIVYVTDSNDVPLRVRSSDGSSMIGISDSNSTNDYSNGIGVYGNALHLTTNESERIRIDASGNVGIGTTSPAIPLHVKGNIRAEDGGSSAFVDLKASQIYATNAYDVIVGTNNPLHFRTSDTRRMTILGGGNVGIGTTTPATPLHVTGEVRVDATEGIAVRKIRSSYFSSTTNLDLVCGSGASIILGDGTARLTIASDDSATFAGDVVVSGGLTVNGTTTTINSTTVQVDDKNIELGSVATPTDTTADGGGITLLAGSNEVDHKTIKWINSTSAWTFSERVAIPAGSASAPSLTFTDDTDTGIFRETSGGNDMLSFSTDGTKRGFFISSGFHVNGSVYSGTNSEFRNYGGTWKATTGATGNGFEFINSVDGTALTISSTGDVVASGKITSGNDIVNATTGVYTWVGDTDTYIQRSAGNEITIKTGASNALVLDSSQNATFAGDLSADNITSTSNGGSASIYINSTRPTLGFTDSNSFTDPNDIYIVRASGNDLKFQWYDDTASSTTDTFSIDNSGNATFAGNITLAGPSNEIIKSNGSIRLNIDSNADQSDRIFIVSTGANSELFRVDESGNGTFTGSVTATSLIKSGGSSSEFLKADGSVDSTSYLPLAGGTMTGQLNIESSYPRINLTDTDHNSDFSLINSNGMFTVYDNTNNGYPLNITSAGNVGIGTTSPSNFTGLTFSGPILDVAGPIQSRTGHIALGGISYRKAALFTSTGNDAPYLDFRVATSGTSSSTTVRMRIDANGSVGIGTTSPSYRLSVDDNSVTNIPKTLLQFDASSIADNGGYNIDFRTSSNDLANRYVARIRGIRESTGALSQLSFWTESGSALEQRMTIRASGDIGIGTTTPDAKLHVHKNSAGSVTAISQSTLVVENNSANAISMLTPNSTTSYLVFGDPEDNQRGYLSYSHADDRMTFKVAGSERMYIDSSGRVGIGVVPSSAELEVNGHFAATTKSFIIDNPKTGGKLQYGVVESDQHSVLVRGKNDTETIELPEEWEWLVDGDSVTVDLTSIGQIQQLFVISQDNKTIKIGGLATNGKYNYTVYGERKDVEKLEVNI